MGDAPVRVVPTPVLPSEIRESDAASWPAAPFPITALSRAPQRTQASTVTTITTITIGTSTIDHSENRGIARVGVDLCGRYKFRLWGVPGCW
jgi:hypothetical protein